MMQPGRKHLVGFLFRHRRSYLYGEAAAHTLFDLALNCYRIGSLLRIRTFFTPDQRDLANS